MFLFLFFLLISAPPAFSQQQDLDREKIEAIQEEIDALRTETSRLTTEERSILSMLDRFNLESEMNSQKIKLLELKQRRTLADLEVLKNSYATLEKNLKSQREYLLRRLVQVYKTGQANYLKMMLQVNNAADMLRSYQYVSFLAKEDQRKINQYRASLQQMEQTRIRMEQERRNLTLLQQDAVSASRELANSRQEKQRLLSAVQQQRDMQLSALSELKTAADQMEGYFRPPTVTQIVPEGASILKVKGSLPWPTAGRVVRTYGVFKHPRFSTTTMSNGIEISAPEGSPVTTVFAGTVVFSEWFKGYGKTVIVQHTSNIYTLYAFNSELLVHRGEQVQQGQVIARVGSTGALNGSTLYFEVREHDKPLNPVEWLRKR